MKIIFRVLPLLVLFACSESKEKNKSTNLLTNLSLSIDSLAVDSGEEIFVPDMLFFQDLSPDGDRVFAFYEPDFEVFEISLKEMKLLKRHPFQREGPDGIKGWVSIFQALPENQLMIYDQVSPNIFSLDGTKVKTYELDFAKMIDFEPDSPFSLPNNMQISQDLNYFFSLPAEFGKPILGLAVFDVQKETGKVYKLPAFDLVSGFQVIFQQGNMASFFGDGVRLQLINDQVLIFCNSTAQIYRYDSKQDSLELIAFEHQLVENQKTGSFPTEVDSRERQQEVANQIRQQISFEKFYWDDSRKLYFRFGTKNFQVSPDGKERTADCYLFVYDEEFQLVGEQFLPELARVPYFGYFMNGDFYSYWPIGDEAGFVRFQFNF